MVTKRKKDIKMKRLIVYSSKTGNTLKLAEAARSMLTGEVDFYPVEEAPDPADYALIVACFWLQAGKPDPKSHAFLEKLEAANLFLIASHGAAADSAHAAKAMAYAKKLPASSEVLGSFNCQGEVNPGFLEKAHQKDPQPPWIADAPAAVGHPDAADIVRLKAAIEASLHPDL
jgi:flavodoxin